MENINVPQLNGNNFLKGQMREEIGEIPAVSMLTDEEEEFFVRAEGKDKGIDVSENLEYGIAVDIGTTTIAMELIELETGKIADVYTSINKQT